MNRTNRPSGEEKGRRAQVLIRRLWTALETNEGRRVTIQELSTYMNLSDSALSDWVTGKSELYQIEAILRLCERLEHSQSANLFLQHLRTYPTLRSPDLAHDPAMIDRLRTLLSRRTGLIFIVGGNSSQRTLLIGVLGNSYLKEGNGRRSLAGWDVHEPSWFVPLPGVLYLPHSMKEPPNLRL